MLTSLKSTTRTKNQIKVESCTKWYQPFHNAVHKQCSHKGITSIEVNQYALAYIWCATGNSVTFSDQNKTMSKQLKGKVVSPLASRYRPKLDASPELDENRAIYFTSLMGVLRWCIKLGRIDIIVEVNLLAHFQAWPREGHLEQMFHLFAYLKQNNIWERVYPVCHISMWCITFFSLMSYFLVQKNSHFFSALSIFFANQQLNQNTWWLIK
jgi:hypothetical protein